MRMLESGIFKRKPRQAALLKGIVEIGLDTGEVTETLLREKVYPQHDSDSSIIRTQMKQLEETTEEYYSGPGEDDPILIFLEGWLQPVKARRQAGWNYMPTFRYNPLNRWTRTYMAAWIKLNSGNLNMIPEAMAAFSEVVNHDPYYVDAWLALGDGYCWTVMLFLHSKPEERADCLQKAADCVKVAKELAPDSWHTHATNAFLSMVRGEPDETDREFAAAIELNRLMTESHPAYPLFRIAMGDATGSEFMESRALELVGNPIAQALHARMLEWAGRIEEAEKFYREALGLVPNNGLCHWGLSRFLEKQGRCEEAALHRKRAEILMDPVDYQLWQDFGKAINEEDPG